MVVYLGKATPASGQGGGSGEAVWGEITGTLADQTDLADALSAKQDTLVSGTNIKTINDESLLGSGNITISGSVPNQNTAVGATNPLEFWEGTEAEYNSGGGSTTFYNWQSGGVNRFDSGVSFEPKSIAYGNGKYIIIGANGKIKSSTDKINWVDETSGVSVRLNSVAFGANKFVVVGASGTILTSSGDGTWTAETSGTSNNITSVCFGNNLFVTGGVGLYSSGDGTWTANNNYSTKVIFAGGYFYGIAGGYRNVEGTGYAEAYVYKSSDAITWNSVVTKVHTSSSAPNLKIIGANNYIYMGYSAYGNWYYAYTADSGTTWTDVDSIPQDILYNNGTYYKIAGAYLQTSTDGTNYTNVGSAAFIQYITYGDALVGVGYNSMESYNFYEIIYNEPLSVYTTDENPTTESTVYSAVGTVSALTITSVGTGTITCTDTNTYTYNSSGNQTVTQTVGQAHPDWICLIEGVGIKKGSTTIANIATVDQTYNASSTNAQSGVAVASGISDTLGTIETALSEV